MNNSFWKFVRIIMIFVIEKICKISLSQEKYDMLIQFLKFGIVGVSNTIVSYVIYILTLLWLQNKGFIPTIDYLVAQFVGFVLSVLWSFYWNNKYVFLDKKEGRSLVCTLLKTYVSYGFTGIILNSILSFVWVEIFHWSKIIAPVVNLLISVPLNFILNKFWAYDNN